MSDARRLAALRDAPLTYAEVGATTTGHLPVGYSTFRRTRVLGSGAEVHDAAVAALLAWDVHRRAGIRVVASGPVTAGAVALLRVGPGPLSLAAPVRVVGEVDEPDRRGFSYGTLAGHPVAGEEGFLVTRASDGEVALTVTVFSRPATRLARLGGPVTRLGQRVLAGRMLHALDGLDGLGEPEGGTER